MYRNLQPANMQYTNIKALLELHHLLVLDGMEKQALHLTQVVYIYKSITIIQLHGML